VPDGLLNRSKYIIFDRKLFDALGYKESNTIYTGKELVFVKREIEKA